MDTENSDGIIASLASVIGANENAFRLLLSLLFGYPLGFLYRYAIYGKPPHLQHLYFTVCGISLCYFNFGGAVIHSMANILLMYVVILTTGGTTRCVILAWIVNMGYLSIGYYATMSEEYIVKWTTPQCVITLRLIGLAYDLLDGREKPDKLNADQKTTALQTTPSLLEVCGHVYMFGGFLVGPQFNMRRYLDFVNGAFSDPETGDQPDSVRPALMRLSAGIGYVMVYQIAQLYFNDAYLVSDDFYYSGFFWKMMYILLWGKFTLYRYVAAWVITEGACILTGLTYNGRDENGNHLWDGCANIYIRNYERGETLQKLILAFNINTNRWMAKYVFKRLKFLGNKHISQGVTLFILAIWHGFYSGYLMNFFLEFIYITFEKSAENVLSKSPALTQIGASSVGSVIFYCLKKIYAQFLLSYALVSFCLFTYDKYFQVYWSVYFFGHIFFMAWPLYMPYLKALLVPRHPKEGDRSQENNSLKSADTEKKEL